MIPLLSFLAPNRLWLLAVIPLLVSLYLWLVQRKRSRTKTIGKTMFDLVIPRDRTWLRHVAVGLSILSLLTLTVAFAKPKDQVSVPRERATVIVAVDVSRSMLARDVEPDRLSARIERVRLLDPGAEDAAHRRRRRLGRTLRCC